MEHLNSRTIELTGITQKEIENAESLESVLDKFQEYVSNSFVVKNKSYCIITFGHWEVGYQVGIEALQKKINNKYWCFTSFFNVVEEFKKGHSGYSGSITKIEHLLDALKLKNRKDVITTTRVSEMNCTNIVRVVHRMCSKEGHKFTNPIDIHSLLPTTKLQDTEVPLHIQAVVQDTKEEVTEHKEEIDIHKLNPTPDNLVKVEEVGNSSVPENINEISIPTIQNPEHPKDHIHSPSQNKEFIPPQIPGRSQKPPIMTKIENEETHPRNHFYSEFRYQEENKDYIQDRYSNEYHPPSAGYTPSDNYDDRRRERPNYSEESSRTYYNRDRSPEPPHRLPSSPQPPNSYSDSSIKYIRVSYLPPNCDKNKIIDFFGSIPIAYANIALVFDQTGRFCQEAILALNSLNDQIEALSQSGRYIFNYQVVVEAADSREWERAQQSQKVFFSRDEKILVRMRGLPFTVKKEEVLMFFSGYDVVPDSVIVGELNNGK